MSDGGSEPPSLLGFVGAEWRGRRGESRERIGWYAFDWANSPMFQAASAVLFVFFLSGIMDAHTSAGSTLETCAALGTCVTDRASFIRGEATCTAADGAPLAVPCRACVEGSGQMRYSPALEKFEPFAPPTVRFMFDVTAETFAGTVIAIASFVQLLVFITCGAWADFGGMRRRGLFISTACSCASLLLMLAVVRPSLYWLAGVLVIIATVCHGLALIYSNAYLPILVELHPAVAAAKASADASGTPVAREAAVATRELIEARVSSLGFMVGYAGGFICFAIAGALLIVSSSGALSSLLAMQIGLAVVSVWWLGFSVITWRTLGEHPGQPVPPARELITIGWRSTATLFARASRLPHTARFMLAWFFLSDTFSVFGGVGNLFAARELCLSFADVAALVAMVIIEAVIGNALWLVAQRRLRLTTKTIVMCCAGIYAFLSLWGLIGAIEASPIGLKSRVELFLFASVHGLTIGAVGAFSRALFSELIEKGKEGEYFAIYEITDKGSSFIGTFLFPFIGQVTGRRRLGFAYLLAMAIVATIVLSTVNAREGAKMVARHHDGTRSDDAKPKPTKSQLAAIA